MQSLTHSTCCSIDTAMFDSTDGLPGPVIRNRLGNPTEVRPRYVRGPSAHFSASDRPSRPVMSTATMAPVMASKPVANTMASNSNDSSEVSMPVSVIVARGVLRRSTRRTWGRLKVSK